MTNAERAMATYLMIQAKKRLEVQSINEGTNNALEVATMTTKRTKEYNDYIKSRFGGFRRG